MTVRQFLLGRWQTALAVAIMLAFVAPVSVHAQTYTVLHTFTGGVDGASSFRRPHLGRRIELLRNGLPGRLHRHHLL